jgi:hypothetical protein
MQSLWLSWVLSRRAEDSECEKGCVGKRSTEDASASMQAPYTKNPLVEVATAHEIAAHNVALVPFWSRRSHRGQLLGDAIKFKIKADDGRPKAFDVTPCDSDALTSCSGDSGYDGCSGRDASESSVVVQFTVLWLTCGPDPTCQPLGHKCRGSLCGCDCYSHGKQFAAPSMSSDRSYCTPSVP